MLLKLLICLKSELWVLTDFYVLIRLCVFINFVIQIVISALWLPIWINYLALINSFSYRYPAIVSKTEDLWCIVNDEYKILRGAEADLSIKLSDISTKLGYFGENLMAKFGVKRLYKIFQTSNSTTHWSQIIDSIFTLSVILICNVNAMFQDVIYSLNFGR